LQRVGQNCADLKKNLLTILISPKIYFFVFFFPSGGRAGAAGQAGERDSRVFLKTLFKNVFFLSSIRNDFFAFLVNSHHLTNKLCSRLCLEPFFKGVF